jgi:iron complex outermembrane receptor protein
MNRNFYRGAVSAAVAALAGAAQAQPLPTPSLGEITVTGNPLGTAAVAPAASLSGTPLLLRSGATLGQTLDGTPGVSSTYFGPNASRPVIRGQDGDRIRILNNGGAALDASSLSYDHAVAIDPIAVERIDVLRGPAALLYGGNAIGGAVNVIDNRIPREPIGGFGGRADLSVASGNRGKSGALMLEGGSSRFGVHADAFSRNTGETRVPLDLACTQAGETRIARRICNSAASADGGAVGGSVFFDRGYLGAALSTFRTGYGSVAEDEVSIGMRSDRLAVEGELRGLGGFFESVKGQASHTDYRHTEFDVGEAGTLFKNRGNALRLEARHAAWGPLQGVWGVQADDARFSADGDEAFAPYSRTRQFAVFGYEELAQSWGKLTFGARAERVTVRSLGHPTLGQFAPGERRFTPASLAIGGLWNLAGGWQLTAQVARSERAPKDYELYADGPHIATGAYEVGDAALGKEQSTQADLGVQWKQGAHRFALSAFASRFRNYIALLPTGATRELDGEPLPEYAYRGVRARFRGVEASGTVRLHEGPGSLDLQLRADLVRATNASAGEPLPRIAPWRAGATLVWAQGPWGAQLGVDHHARQDRVAAGEAPVAGSTFWNAAATYRMKAGGADLLWFARLDNAADRLAYSATSILTQSAPGRVPLPGRSVKVGLQASF